MELNENFLAEIIDNGVNGSGIAKQNGFVCFIPYTIKGEKIFAKIDKIKKNFCECSLVEIDQPSAERVAPLCPYFQKCGGCQLQHTSKNFQLEYKVNQLKNTLQKILMQKINIAPCVSKNEYFYRNKINFAIQNNKLCFADNNNNFFSVDNCPLFKINLQEIIKIVNNYLSIANPNFKALHIRYINNKFQFTFVSSSTNFPKKEILINSLLKNGNNFSLSLSVNKIKNSSNITDNTICVFGDEKLDFEIFNVKNKISPASFLQVNEEVQNAIYEDINSKILSSNNVINAYGGTGILSSIIANKANKVFSIEINKSASKNCEEMILENNLQNVFAICGDCKIEIPKLLQKENISHIIFDPPRSGIDCSILENVLNLDIPNILYLSCNPATLARDLKLLSQKYSIELIQPYDMFPQTSHIETLTLLKIRG